MLSSTIGGYLTGRLRTKWAGLHSEEVLFRDTAHGFMAWALATVLAAAALGAAATYVVGGVVAGVAQGAGQSAADPNEYFVNALFRPAPGSQASAPATQSPGGQTGSQASAGDAFATRRDVRIIFTKSLTAHGDLPAADRSYVSQMVAARTGLPPAEADKRVTEVFNQAKAAADQARKDAAALSIWLAISMLVGAFSASLAALEGGQLRDGRWTGIIGGKNYRGVETT
jgi:hypothetical protein